MPAAERVIVALDVRDLAGLEAFFDRLEGQARFCKVGLELFVAEGAAAVEAAQRRGSKVFLDLKLHDIPETVARAVASATSLGAELLTVHTAGGFEMVRRAAHAARESAKGRPRILGVTVLTSLSEEDLRADGIGGGMREAVVRRARLAEKAGAAGVVCSPQEVADVRAASRTLALVVPGVRPAGTALGDQKRVATPACAIAAGADYLVVGRPIRDATSPAAAFAGIVAEVEAALAEG
ncbi:MAG: orotidine-5'-phosphate decarboxylase [Deltaproteobacteria bacterium]|nr:orotidine-5'-phosphate decarboxylase [Deltaproteobacteria bacterium]